LKYKCRSPIPDSREKEKFLTKNPLVKLAISNQETIEKNWQNPERDFHIEQHFSVKQEIKIEDILSKHDLTIVSGIAGIGKSTLVQQIMGAWSQGEIWNNAPNILLAISLRCRDLNIFCIKEDTELIKIIKKFNSDLEELSADDFKLILNRTLLILDGVDEFKDIETIRDDNVAPHVKLIKDALNPNTTICKYRIILGRPIISPEVQNVMIRQYETQFTSIEVCGFDEDNVNLYIEEVLSDKKEEVAELKKKIEESLTLRAMSTVPVFLWSICGIYSELTEIPKTVTELLLYNLIFFVHQHWKSNRNLSLGKIF